LKLAVVIPALNEERTIADVVRGVPAQIPRVERVATVVVDDGCSDATARIASECGAVVIRLPYNLGIGGAVQTGLRYALAGGFDIAVRLDGDGQHRPTEIAALVEAVVRKDGDMVVGSRFVADSGYRPSFSRRCGIWLFSRLASVLCGQRFTDTTSGFFAANRLAMAHLAETYACDYPEIESLITLKKAGFSIAEVPVNMEARAAGTSSIDALQAAYYAVKVLITALVAGLAAPRRARREMAQFHDPDGVWSRGD